MAAGRLDPRINAYRDDLAAEYLKEKVDAPRYARGEPRQVIAGSAPLRLLPRFDALLETELLFGEIVTVYDESEGWAWAQAEGDAYVGYAPCDALSAAVADPTHRVAALRTYLYAAPDIKAPPLDMVSMNARVAIAGEAESFARLADGRFISAAHLAEAGDHAGDFVAVAEQFLGTPYLWGGRTSVGVDCSGLIQLALQAEGRDCPRDTDLLEKSVGMALSLTDNSTGLRRGDLVFWEDHMGVMLDAEQLLHANAFHMATAIEPLNVAVARIAGKEGPVTSIRRMDSADTV